MKLIIDEQNDGKRIDAYLAESLQDTSRSKIQKLIKSNDVIVNNFPIKPSYMLKEDDIVEIISIDKLSNNIEIFPQNIPLDIAWEDENMAVINKPSGMLTHPTTLESENTLVNALLYKYKDNLSDLNGYMRPGIVHRLDRNTSGLIMVAKNNNTHEFLVNRMKERKFNKVYLAVVKGVIEENNFIIDTPIGRHITSPNKMAVNGKNAKEAISKIKVLERFKDASFVEVNILTGRTHQIRVHLSSISHPVYNDTLYGFGKMKIKTEEQALQSYKLGFIKPFSDEYVELQIDADEKIKKVLNFLKN